MRTETKAAIIVMMGTTLRRALLAGLALIALTSCGGGGDEGGLPPTPNPNVGSGRLAIEAPTENPTYTTESEELLLSGSAFISPTSSRCCSGSADDTGVGVSWSNAAGGGGAAFQSALYCQPLGFGPLALCDHVWSASIPLVVGANVVTMTASDPNGNIGRDTITITRLPDTRPPTISSTVPANGATAVALNSLITVLFSEAMDGSTITPTTVLLEDSFGNRVGTAVASSGRSATLDPMAQLAASATYRVTITTGVRDLAGNALAASHSWTFTTGVARDTTPPAVTATSPDNGVTCVAIDSRVTASFNEPINSTTVNSNTFTLKDANQNTPIGATISILSDRSFALVPLNALSYSSSYVATLGAGIKDLPGNATAANFIWTFTTPPGGLGSWQATSTNQASPATGHTAVWTGTEMIVWGATTGQFFSNVGQRYRPNSDTWTPVNGVGAPAARINHVAVWTGHRMIIWSGSDNGAQNGARGDGSLYDPITDTWQPISSTNAPARRTRATAVWTGTEMLVWGGMGANSFLPEIVGGRYNPTTDTWQPMSTVGAPPAMYGHTAIWTGSRMIVWGGISNPSASPASTGGVYDPVTDTWELTATPAAPSGRTLHTAVWTGTEMAIWGGRTLAGVVDSGGLYDLQTKMWRPISTTCGPAGRSDHTAIWNGSEMIVWGGSKNGAFVGTGARYNPTTDAWQHVSLIGAPARRLMHTAVWTGTTMIIWGGQDLQGVLKSGATYQP